MQLFYVPVLKEGRMALPEGEARHATQVLRKKAGDTLDIVDGQGGWYQAEVLEIGKRSCTVEVSLVRQEQSGQVPRIVLAVSPTKTNERFEWFLEKATEIGVSEIVPLQCKRTERPRIRLDRYEKVLVSAMKQSLQAWLPKLHPMTSFKQWMQQPKQEEQRFIGWCEEMQQAPLVKQYEAGREVIILIGPEGDFTEEEVAMAQVADYAVMTLGDNRLRTETAALAALHSIRVLNAL